MALSVRKDAKVPEASIVLQGKLGRQCRTLFTFSFYPEGLERFSKARRHEFCLICLMDSISFTVEIPKEYQTDLSHPSSSGVGMIFQHSLLPGSLPADWENETLSAKKATGSLLDTAILLTCVPSKLLQHILSPHAANHLDAESMQN